MALIQGVKGEKGVINEDEQTKTKSEDTIALRLEALYLNKEGFNNECS